MAVADKTTEVSEKVLEAVKNSQQAAIDAVRTFVDTVDKSLPLHGEGPSRRQEVIDSGLSMAARLVQTQYDFLSNIVAGAGEALGASPTKKSAAKKSAAKKSPAKKSPTRK